MTYELALSELTQHEAAIERNFVDAGMHFRAISEGQLYRAAGYSTWEDYCQEKWGRGRNYINRLIASAAVVQNLVPIGTILPASESQARPLAPLAPDEQREAWDRVVKTAPNGRVTADHVQSVVDEMTGKNGNGTGYKLAAANHAISDTPGYDGDEWYTPAEYIAAAREVMGNIDLDPASCDAAQEVIQARHFYTKDDDGLGHSWRGRVWLNPPYSMPLIKQFADKLLTEFDAGRVTEAIVITNNSSDTAWFHSLLTRCPACFTRGRVSFWRPDHEAFGTRQGQTLFYLGENTDRFVDVFSRFGIVVYAA